MNNSKAPALMALALAAGLFAGGCSAPDDVGLGKQSPNRSSTPAEGDVEKLFTTGLTLNADQFWRANPELMPGNIASAELLLNVKDKGPKDFKLPPLNDAESLIVVLTCNAKVAYQVLVVDANGNQRDQTQGASCGGPNINSYRTAPFTSAVENAAVRVDVPAETEYYITAYRSTISAS